MKHIICITLLCLGGLLGGQSQTNEAEAAISVANPPVGFSSWDDGSGTDVVIFFIGGNSAFYFDGAWRFRITNAIQPFGAPLYVKTIPLVTGDEIMVFLDTADDNEADTIEVRDVVMDGTTVVGQTTTATYTRTD